MKVNLILAVLLFTVLAQAQVLKPHFSSIDSAVAIIRDRTPEYKKVEKYKDTTGTRCAYLNKDQLMFTRAEIVEQGIRKRVDWYFKNGQIIYCEQNWWQLPSKQVVNNEKLYVKDGKLLAWLVTDGRSIDRESRAFKETEFRLVEYSKVLLKEAGN